LNIALQSVIWRGSTLKSKSTPKNDLILSNPFVDRETIKNKLFVGKSVENEKVIDEAEKDDKDIEVKKEEEILNKGNKKAIKIVEMQRIKVFFIYIVYVLF
jgi:uncharacterized membrane protein